MGNAYSIIRHLIWIAALLIPWQESKTQDLSKKISMTFQGEPMPSALKKLEKETGYNIIFVYDDVKAYTVDAKLVAATVDQALKLIIGSKPLSYTIGDKHITVTASARARESSRISTTRRLTGRVIDRDKLPLTGASVRIKDSDIGVATGMDGTFSLDVVKKKSYTLIISFIGMETVEVPIQASDESETPLGDITLKDDENVLGEVVVTVNTGYQGINKERMTGSYAVVTAKDLENSNFMSVDRALEGKVAGLYAVSTSGAPGTRSDIRIRGDNSIAGNKEPLWVVDGLPLQEGVASIQDLTQGNIQESILNHGVGNLSPSDIESVTILKDAAATAIYGAMAANGVIVVTTKKGGEGPVAVNYQGNFAISSAPRMRDFGFMNAAEKVQFEVDLMEEFQQRDQNNGAAARLWDEWKRAGISDAEYYAGIQELSSVNVNWFDELYRTGFSQSHYASLRGGTEKFWMFGSIRLQNDEGALKTNSYKTLGANMKIGYRPYKDVTVDLNVTANYRSSNDHNSAVNPFNYAVFANPYIKAYNEDGSYATDNTWLKDKSELSIGFRYPFNILREMENTFNRQKATDMTGTLSAKWNILPTLTAEAHGRIGYSTNNTEAGAAPGTYSSMANYWSMLPFNGGELPASYNNGYMRVGNSNSHSYAMRASLAYSNIFDDKHYVSAFLGTEIRSSESRSGSYKLVQWDPEYWFGTFPEYPQELPFDKNMQLAVGRLGAYTYGNKDNAASFMSALTYTFHDRYVFNGNVRFDGAGTIDAKNRFTPLWSASLKWNVHREKWIKENAPFISELSVRGVFGYTGNIDKRALPYSWIILSPEKFDGSYVAGQIYYPNPSIKWERKTDRNLGLDFSLFNNLLGGTFNYYNNITRDLLGVIQTPPSYGNPRLVMNGHDLRNKGWELGVNLRLRFGKDIRWINSFNISHNENSVEHSDLSDPSDYTNPKSAYYWRGFTLNNVEGYPTGTTFGYRFAGVDPLTGDGLFYLSEKAREAYATAHQIPLAEAPTTWAMNNIYVGGGLTYQTWYLMSIEQIGNVNPQYYGGFSSTFQWKNIEVRAQFTYATGHIIRTFSGGNYAFEYGVGDTDMHTVWLNVLKTTANRWRVPGDITDVPRFIKETSVYNIMLTDNNYQRGDYLAFRDLEVNYNLRSKYLEQIGLDYMRVGLQVENLANFSKFRSTDITTGSAFGYPRTRKFLMNLQLTF